MFTTKLAGIAQGAVFVVFGQQPGPAQLVQVSSYPLPTSQGLAGTSIRITVAGTSVDAIMLYTLATQVAAVVPSNTPVGTRTFTVTYNGQASAPAPITVVPSSFGPLRKAPWPISKFWPPLGPIGNRPQLDKLPHSSYGWC